MNNKNDKQTLPLDDDMRPEYDFSNGVRGKHAQQYRQGHTVTIHKPDGTLPSEDRMTTSSTRPPVSIGKVVQHASVFNLKRWHNAPMNVGDLLQTVERLFGVLEARRIDYVLVGGIALLQYVEGRNTEEIALIMAVADLQKLPELTIASQDTNFARGAFNQLQIDILFTRNPLFDTVRQRYATMQPFTERTIPCATVEGLLVLKLYALPSLYRQGNFTRVGLYENDVATLIYNYKPPMEPLFQELASHLTPTDLASVRDIVTNIQQRIARFDQGQDTNT